MKCCDLTSGKLRHKITIEREMRTSDGRGGEIYTWTTLSTPFAYIKPLSGGERLQAMKLESNITHKIYLRYTSEIKVTDRINYQGRIMQIRYIIDLEERQKWLELHCEEGKVN